MKLLKDEGIITVTVSEFAAIARRRISASLPIDENEPSVSEAERAVRERHGFGEKVHLSSDFEIDGTRFRLFGYADAIDGASLSVIRVVSAVSKSQKKSETAEIRGEAFLLAEMLADSRSFGEVKINITYINRESGEREDTEEYVSKSALDRFFTKCAKAVSDYAVPEIERVTTRLPSFEKMKFPYDDVRAGQEEFIRQAYRAIARGETLFACAPTGTGKTISAIYPALKALGKDKCDKVFYLTPKTTTANAARDCLKLLSERGVSVRGIILTSKEKSCPNRLICREAYSLCPMASENNLAKAVMAVYSLNKPVIDIDDIRSVALSCTVCPYELELAYSELCDIVICDFNYLFDPVVYIRRFFEKGGRFAFLVDEAHNLADRGREMYSAELILSDIDVLLTSDAIGAMSVLRDKLPKIKSELCSALMPYLKDEIIKSEGGERGAVHLSDIPSSLYTLTDELCSTLSDEEKCALAAKDNERNLRLKLIRDLLYKVKKLAGALNSFDTGYRLFLFYENSEIRINVFCIDTGKELEKRLARGYGTVFFSATLSPIEYYKSVLTDDKYADSIAVDSPFDPSQLSVSIMDKISTRYSEREKTLPAVTRVIAGAMSAKKGHYMVFTPSFEYAELLYRYFSAKYPQVKCLLQSKEMTALEKKSFTDEFSKETDSYLLGFCVMGGIYSEGIDLAGDLLIGAIVVGIGMPSLSYEREAIAEYFEEKHEAGKQFAYIYPGMNRVFQAAGRVIRREEDRGIIVLIDDRFADPIYKKSIPSLWQGMQYITDAKELNERLKKFWNEH